MLAAMTGLVLASPSLPRRAAGAGPAQSPEQGFCPNPGGRDLLISPVVALNAACADCKWHSMVACREAIDDGAESVRLCMTVTDDPEEHVFAEINGRIVDRAWEAGMPVRVVREFIAVRVWPIAPG
jgi:hypothetical protein